MSFICYIYIYIYIYIYLYVYVCVCICVRVYFCVCNLQNKKLLVTLFLNELLEIIYLLIVKRFQIFLANTNNYIQY